MPKMKRKKIADMIAHFYDQTKMDESTDTGEIWELLDTIHHGISGKCLDELPYKYLLEFWCYDCFIEWEMNSDCACEDECPKCETPYLPINVTERR